VNGFCPQCDSDQFQVTYVLIKVEHCPDCSLYSQYRVPILPFQGGYDMITRVTDTTISKGYNLAGLQAVLTRQLAKVERRQAKIANRNNGGSPNQEKKWR